MGKSTQNLCKTDFDLKTRPYVKDGIFATSRYNMLQLRASEYEQNQKKKIKCKKKEMLHDRYSKLKNT